MTPAAEIAAPIAERRLALQESAIVFFAAAILLVSAVFWADRAPVNEKTDFSVTYIGSRMISLGLEPKLYDVSEQRKLKSALLPDSEPLIFEHPPFEAFLLAPLGALPYKTAYLIWGLINVAIWLTLPYLLRPYLPVPRDDLGYAVLWLMFAPVGVALFQGQSSIILLLLYALTFLHLKRGNHARAGALLALGLFKFQFVLPFALIFLLRRQWRFLQGFAASAAGLGVISLVAVGWQGIISYIRLLTAIAAHPDNSSFGAAIGMATLQGFVHAVAGSVLGKATGAVVALLSLALIAWTAWRWSKVEPASSKSFDLMFAASAIVSLVTGFHMFTHDLSPLILSMLLVAANISSGQRRWSWTLKAILVLLWVPFLYFGLLAWHRVYLLFPVLMVLFAGCIATLKNTARGFASE